MSKTPRVLIADDEMPIRAMLAYNLAKMGFEVVEASDGEIALDEVAKQIPDLVVVDWMMPNVSGLEVCRRLRQRHETKNIPVIMLTARGEETDRIRGLDMGADDYLVKPFSVTELQARVRALLRRGAAASTATAVITNTIEHAGILIDKATRRVHRNNREVVVGPREFALLCQLMETPGKVYSRTLLLELIWGQDKDVDERTVDVHIGRLRKALSRDHERDPIRTVRAAGYAIDETLAAGAQ